MKLHDSKVSDANVTRYNGQLAVADLFPPVKARRFGNNEEVINGAGADLLAAIHAEIGDWEENEAAALKEWTDEQDRLRDLGLITEINTKVDDSTVGETMDRITALLERHQFGYKSGIHRTEDRNGAKKLAAGRLEDVD